MLVEKYPLQWPMGYPRSKRVSSSRFGSQSFAKCRDEIFKQLRIMLTYKEESTIVLSTNIELRLDGLPYANMRQPEDKGIAVYFMFKGEQMVVCCDEWNKIEHNLWAVAKTIEAMRAVERWGVSDFMKRSFSGFTALPPPLTTKPKREWWVVLNYSQRPGTASWDWAGVEAQYRSLAKKLHPDMPSGSTEMFQELSNAFQEAKSYFNK